MMRTMPFLLLLLLLLSLGFWQLHRAEEKRDLLALQALQQNLPAAPLDAVQTLPDPAWRHVRLKGRFDAEHSVLLDNSSRNGQVGVELLQPFADDISGLWVLINRGWLPWPDRRQPPLFTTPETDQTLQAWVYVPPSRAFRLQDDAPSSDWPRLVTLVNLGQIWNELGRPGYAHQLRLMPGPAAYRVDWPVVNMSPDTHRGYAVQWFTMAAVLLILLLYLRLKTLRGRPS